MCLKVSSIIQLDNIINIIEMRTEKRTGWKDLPLPLYIPSFTRRGTGRLSFGLTKLLRRGTVEGNNLESKG